MIDPERLSRNSSSPLASLLLRAGAEETPSAAALRRATRAATLAAAAGTVAQTAGATATRGTAASAKGAAVTGASGGAAAATGGAALTLGAVAPWLGIGILGGLLAVPLLRAVLPEQEQRPKSVIAPPTRVVTPPPAPVEARSAARVVPSVGSDDTEPSKKLEARRPQPVAPAPSIEEAEPLGVAPGALLAAEVKFVEQGRSALQRGALAEALAVLSAYEAQFPPQQLLTEVLFLRMEAESRLGNTERARTLARRIVGRGVPGPQAARARELLDR